MTRPRFASTPSRGTASDVIVIAALWCLAVVIANPIGDFPLNDDWSYGMTVRRLVSEGVYQPTGWASMPFVTHVLWGALFTIPDGFSFTALRLSSLALSLAGALAMYGLIREIGGARLVAVTCSLALAFNPVYFALSHTFMADVPFTTWVILASWLFVRHLRTESSADLVLATVCSIAATLTRQLGLCAPLAFAVTLMIHRGFDARRLARVVAPTIVVLMSLIAFERWLEVTNRMPALYTVRTQAMARTLGKLAELPIVLTTHVWTGLMYLGLFSLPLLAFQAGRSKAVKYGLLVWTGVLLFLGVSVVRFVLNPSVMPVGLNVLVREGIGPLSVRTAAIPELPWSFWLCVTGLTILGAAQLIVKALGFGRDLIARLMSADRSDEGMVKTFFFLSACAYLVPLLPIFSFDRYFVPPTAFIMAFLVASAGEVKRTRQMVALAGVICLAAYAVVGTRDYLEWNRQRWRALNDLLHDRQVTPADIDGGFEFNGLHLYSDRYVPIPGKSVWWVKDDNYVVGLSALDGYETMRRYPYQHWLPPYEGAVLVLKRKPAQISATPVPK